MVVLNFCPIEFTLSPIDTYFFLQGQTYPYKSTPTLVGEIPNAEYM